MPVRRLDWHYRSRDEALIAFSNHFYYDGGLVTFPSPGGAGDALRLHRVGGRYGRGRGRSNAEEARAVTAMLRARLDRYKKADAPPPSGFSAINAFGEDLEVDYS